jgi:dUTP pyrophosphatase
MLKIAKINPNAVLPKYGKVGDSGFDLYSVEYSLLEPRETRLIRTGLIIELEPNTELQIRPRSGYSLKTKLRVIFGTVDQNYRGEIGIIVENTSPLHHACIYPGDKIAQGILVPVKIEEICEVPIEDIDRNTERGSKGFGSTGI